MNKLVWISATVLLLVVAYTIMVSFSNRRIETPDYKVVKTYGEVEIRQYPRMIVAKTSLADTSYDKNRNNGFRTIANYIFGGNERGQEIAMTSPVVMNMGDSASMYFIMPSQYDKDALPKPNSTQVRIEEVLEKKLAVISFGGYASDKKIEEYRKKLQVVIERHQLKTKGSFLYMGYNAPWDVVNRRNDVAIEVVD